MAATNLENQLHSAQKNLLFLQREHASTLKGLHAEIRRLQQHCTGTRGPVPPPGQGKVGPAIGTVLDGGRLRSCAGLARGQTEKGALVLSAVGKPAITGAHSGA